MIDVDNNVAAVGRLPSAGVSETQVEVFPCLVPVACLRLACCSLRKLVSVIECGLVQCWREKES